MENHTFFKLQAFKHHLVNKKVYFSQVENLTKEIKWVLSKNLYINIIYKTSTFLDHLLQE